MAKLGTVIDTWMAQTQVAISAVQCWTSLEEYFGVVPAVMSMMSENLMSSACEVDICGVVGMHALQLASQTPNALLDWNNNYGDDPDKAVCFHCSNLPKHFFKNVRMDFQEIISGHGRPENTACVGLVKSGPMSFARFSTNDVKEPFRGYLGEGPSLTIPSKPSAERAWFTFRICRRCCATSASADSNITSLRISRPSHRLCTKPPRDISAGASHQHV